MQIDTLSEKAERTSELGDSKGIKLLDFLDIEEWASDITAETAHERIWDELKLTAGGSDLEYVRAGTKDKMESLKTTRFVPGKLEGDPKYHETVIGSSLVATIAACLDLGGSLMKVVFYWGVDTVQLGLYLDNKHAAEHRLILDLEEEVGKTLMRPEFSDAEFEVYEEKSIRINALEASCKEEYEASTRETRSSAFETSPFHDKFLVEKKIIELQAQRKAEKMHYESVVNYKVEKAFQEEKQKQLARMKKTKESYLVARHILDFYGRYFNEIAKAVRDVAGTNPEVMAKLSGQVTIPTSGQIVTNPYDSVPLNLPAIFHALYKNYKKANLVVFFRMLMNLMNMTTTKEDSDLRPQVTVEKMVKVMYQWQQMKLYNYMDEDKLFTCNLLRSFHPDSEVRKEGVKIALEFAQQLECLGPSPAGERPLFTKVSSWITDILVPSRMMGKESSTSNNQGRGGAGSSPTKAYSPAPATVSSTANNNWKSNSKPASRGTESAAAVQEDKKCLIKPPFTREVTRSDNFWTKDIDTGSHNLYTATKVKCAGCNMKTESSRCQKPRCYLGQCSTCGLFGHKFKNCNQAPNFGSQTASYADSPY